MIMVVVKKFSLLLEGIIIVVFIIPSVILTAVNIVRINAERNPDIDLKTPDLLTKYGYPNEIHHVITEDGYILEMHRVVAISAADSNSKKSLKGAVLLQHGLAGSSADWVIMGPKKSLAYLLADQGYDVWLGNSRGNLYSRNHTILLPTNKEFWDFSWHEMGVFDLPAMIDHILDQTQRKKIFYIGHSQGTTQFWVMGSELPEYNKKIIIMAAFAPSAYTANLKGPVEKLSTLTQLGVWVGENFGYPEFSPRSNWGKFVSSFICRDTSITQFFCTSIIFLIAGNSPDELDLKNLPVIAGHIPAGASWKQFIHYGQGTMEQGRFRKFDYYNSEKNLRIYNSSIPPEYLLQNILAPVALFSSENDWLATPKDVSLLESKLPNSIFNYKIPTDSFNHYDFLWGIHVRELIYDHIFKLFKEYAAAAV